MKEETYRKIAWGVLAVIVIAGAGLGGYSYYYKHTYAYYSDCDANEKEVGVALELFATEHGDHYPKSLSELVPKYMTGIPICPAAGTDTYSASYQVSKNREAYTFFCSGSYHLRAGAQANYPQYTSTNGISKPPF